MKQRYFITGIGTGIGKTVVSAILTEALQADYWKPLQAGNLDNTDSMFVRQMLTNSTSHVHPETYRLTVPASPHAAAKADGVRIRLQHFVAPEANNHLIVEGAGGLMVPLNDDGDLVADLIRHLNMRAIVVSQNYLGSINHTLLTIEVMKSKGIALEGIIFNGPENAETKSIILKNTGVRQIASIPQIREVSRNSIHQQALKLNDTWRI